MDFMIIFLTVWAIISPKSDLVYRVFKDLPQKDFEKIITEFNNEHPNH